jgi:hypothetical protein
MTVRVPMVETNPYRVEAGGELDQLIHCRVMGRSFDSPPAYSNDPAAAKSVLAKLKQITHARVVVGRTALQGQKWFARYETDPSDGTEVFGDTPALAICRLALVHATRTELHRS